VNAPAIEWPQTPDRRTWRAASGVVVLTVTRLSDGMFGAMVEGPDGTWRSQPYTTRLAAQARAESHAGVTR
jgi:hypothetical protein